MRFRKDHDLVVQLCLAAETLTDVELRLGTRSPNPTLRKYIKFHKIPMPKYLGVAAAGRRSVANRKRLQLSDLVAGVLISNGVIKALLFREGVRDEKCEQCGWCERRSSDGKIPLELHHKNGDTSDCRLDNLSLLCPNCHSLTENYCSKNRRNPGRDKQHSARLARMTMPDYPCLVCGKLGYNDQYCSARCRGVTTRRVPRPSEDQLRHDIATLPWTAIGEKYGVSDNATRKWARLYGIDCEPRKRAPSQPTT